VLQNFVSISLRIAEFDQVIDVDGKHESLIFIFRTKYEGVEADYDAENEEAEETEYDLSYTKLDIKRIVLLHTFHRVTYVIVGVTFITTYVTRKRTC
jgi:hypothetical protein